MKTLFITLLLLVVPMAAQVPPAVVVQPAKIVLTATADGTQPFTYQWRKNGVALAGEIKAELVITDPKATGAFDCVVSNSAGSITTPPVRLGNTSQADASPVTITRKQP